MSKSGFFFCLQPITVMTWIPTLTLFLFFRCSTCLFLSFWNVFFLLSSVLESRVLVFSSRHPNQISSIEILNLIKILHGVPHPCRKPGLDFQGLAIVKLTRGENVVVTFVVNQHRIFWISVFNNVRNVFKRLWWRSRTKISTLRPHILQVMSYGK